MIEVVASGFTSKIKFEVEDKAERARRRESIIEGTVVHRARNTSTYIRSDSIACQA